MHHHWTLFTYYRLNSRKCQYTAKRFHQVMDPIIESLGPKITVDKQVSADAMFFIHIHGNGLAEVSQIKKTIERALLTIDPKIPYAIRNEA